MPELLDIHEFCKDLPEITSSKIMDRRKYHASGLFSEQIFGPVRNYTCQCGTYYGISKEGGKCSICEVDIVSSIQRRRRFAKIILPVPIMNPLFYDLLHTIGNKYLTNNIDMFLTNEKSILYEKDNDLLVTTNVEAIPFRAKTWHCLDAVEKLVDYFTDDYIDKGYDEWKIIKKNLNKLILREVIVLPPELRPTAKGATREKQSLDEINRFYVQILTKKETIKGTVIDISDKRVYYQYFKPVQKIVNELYEHILQKLSKKTGLIRGNILGKRIDFSGRAIIVPDPTLDLDECSLPYKMVLELFKIPIAKKLIEIGKFRLFNEAIDLVSECSKYNNKILFNLCKQIVETDEVCLLNRQPTLHSLSILGFKIRVNSGQVIRVHPLICAPFNADFDGDQMAVYLPISEKTKQEVYDKFLITNNLKSPADETLTTTPSQDIILGIYSITTYDLNLGEEVKYKGENITAGMKIFNDCLPEDYKLINESINKKKLLTILNDININYDKDIMKDVLGNIQRTGFVYATLFGVSMSLDSCIVDGSKEFRDKLYESKDSDIKDQLTKVTSKETENFLRDKFNYSYMIESGSRGSWDQVRQIVLTRGFISNFEGRILDTPIKHSLIDGLTQEEFFNSTYGSRKGLLDVAINTGFSGYLSRKLIFSSANLQISKTLEDCGTTDTLEVYVKNEQKARTLLNRYHIINGQKEKIIQNNYKDYIGKTVWLRSPIYCKNEKVCHTCYGDLYKNLNSTFIGIIAAQTLGEASTQLTLRTFHTSGVAVTKENQKDEDMRQMDIISDLTFAAEVLHRFKDKTEKDITSDLFDIYGSNRSIHHIHYECIVSQLMWVDRYKWRLLENRNKLTPKFHSIQAVPAFESWLLGLSFGYPKQNIIKGILDSGLYKGIFDKLLLGEKV